MHVLTRYTIVEALAALVAADPALRASLPIGLDVADPTALVPHLDTVRTALHAALDRVPVEDVARRVRARIWAGSRPEPVRPMADAVFAENLSGGDAVRIRRGLHRRLLDQEYGADKVVLELPDRRIQLPVATAAAVRTLLTGHVSRIGGLPGMDEADQIVLVRRLLREGVLIPAVRP